MLYDCFPFFDEFELLQVRLHELADLVDQFVLVESTKTHSGEPKPLYYAESRRRFGNLADRIVHVVVFEHA
jgi:beta-1,4-mannosyl-glycoprotein beta-1,4-N-acetylglucosaminyltransferase